MRYENEKLKSISFPLGGIGTGSIGLMGNGALGDFEIFNRPRKNTYFGYTFFALRAKVGGERYARVLMGDTTEHLMGRHSDAGWSGYGFGPSYYSMSGFPHFRRAVLDADFPVATLSLSDGDAPFRARLLAFNPFIPHNDLDSSLPAAFFEWEIENISDDEAELEVILNIENPSKSSKNSGFAEGDTVGAFLRDGEHAEGDIGYFDLCAATDAEGGKVQSHWYRGAWRDGITTFWRELLSEEGLSDRSYPDASENDRAAVASALKLGAGERGRVRFVLSWSCPVQYNYWSPCRDENGKDATWLNYYATKFENSRATALYSLSHFDELRRATLSFTEALHGSTLPSFVSDAVSANLSVLKSPTVLRLSDGALWAWEGLQERAGSCDGSCQHVWNYAYALPYLFPKLERSLREGTMLHALYPDGSTDFRVALPHGREHKRFRPCLDGQMGEVIKCYREWRISGDDEWLRRYADKIFLMMDYAHSDKNPDRWDADRDGVLEGRQHHTLDMELFGPSSWLQGMYLLALDCAAKMADALGENERAREYRRIYELGRRYTNEKLFNGKYFIHEVDLAAHDKIASFGAEEYWNSEKNEIKYQIGDGCFIDQMLSDFHAALIGAEPIFDKEKKLTALRNLYKNNYHTSMREVTNMWRNFAVNDESAAIMCTYPDGARKPAIPVPYCEEAMSGFEYALAALLITEGEREAGENIIRSVRERYDGERRNPFAEMECGANYARSMASFALLQVYSGFKCDMTRGFIGFSPIDGTGRFLFSVGESWGTVTVDADGMSLDILGAPIPLRSLGMPKSAEALSLTVDGKELPFTERGGEISFDGCNVTSRLSVKFK